MESIWLRHETKAFERRTLLLPEHAGLLVNDGCQVVVEKSDRRIFSDEQYSEQGCTLARPGEWVDAPLEAYILGIKSLPEESTPLCHKHLYFAHVYKGQKGSQQILQRFKEGGGTLYDLEFLTNFRGKQLVTQAAGYWAGICGAAMSVLIWYYKQLGEKPPYNIVEYYESYASLLDYLRTSFSKTTKPEILIIGPYGMVGSGVRNFLNELNIPYTIWTRAHTKAPGPFIDIFNYDILLNCIMADANTPRFLTKDILDNNERLSVIGDISCDPTSPYNPLPLYDRSTTFKTPTVQVGKESHIIDIMAIDNVTTFLPLESSLAMSEQIFPYLCELLIMAGNFKWSPWERVLNEFRKHVNNS